MRITRLIYLSENHIDPAEGSMLRVLGGILAASTRNNKPLGLTGALLFDDRWFLQALEGDREKVWRTFERIGDDERHGNIMVAEVVETDRRVFGNWWMGLATRNAKTEGTFAAFSSANGFDPRQLSAAEMLSLMTALAAVGFDRALAPIAA